MDRFITFEGGEGCGKSTLIKNLEVYFNEHDISYEKCYEPGGVKELEPIRNFIKYSGNVSNKSLLLFFSACRSHLCDSFIKPNIEQGKIVICDRFYDSTRVYQGQEKEVTDELIMKLTNFAIKDCKPQLTFLLDIDPIKAFERKGGKDKGDFFENQNITFHQNVRRKYHKIAENEPERVKIIDATKSPQEVLEAVLKILKEEKVINA